MSGQDRRLPLSRRQMLILSGIGASAMAGLTNALDADGESGKLNAGRMALSQAYKVADGVWVGPDGSKSTVDADSGNLYLASDTEVDYYGDGGSWVKRSIGSSSEPVPSVSTERIGNAQFPDYVVHRDGADAVAIKTSDGSELSRNDAVSGRGAWNVLQDVIDDMGSSGGHLYIRSGTYSADSVDTFGSGEVPLLVADKDFVTISGDGAATVLTIEDAATPSDEGANIIHVTGDLSGSQEETIQHFTIRDLTIDGNQQNNGGDGDGNTISNTADGHNIQIQSRNFVMQNVRSINSTGDGVEPISRKTETDGDPQTKNGVIADCVFEDNWEQCVHIHGGMNIAVVGNVMDGEVNNGVLNLYSEDTDVKNIAIVGNVIQNGTVEGALLRTNEAATAARNILFANNIVEGCGTDGISTRGDSVHTTENCRIVNNIVRNNGSIGIDIEGDAIVVEDNDVIGNGDQGIRAFNQGTEFAIRDNRVIDNNQNDGGSAGITYRVNDDTATIRNLSVRGNEVISTGTPTHFRGIFLRADAAATYENIRVEDNVVEGASTFARGFADSGFGALTLGNRGMDNSLSSVPASITPYTSMEYLDDGTNTDSGALGYRVHDGSSWHDVGPVVTGNNDTDDAMTADPETASESGYIEVQVGGSTKQVPFYDP